MPPNSMVMKLIRERDLQRQLRLGALAVLVADGVITSGRARELGQMNISEQRAYLRKAWTDER